VSIARAFLDRGFFNIESIRALMDLDVPFIIPAMKNKKISRAVEEAHLKGRYIPCTDNRVFITDYTMGRGAQSITVKLVVVLESRGKEWKEFAYVTNMDVTLGNALLLAESYRKRWVIETGYRVKEEVRGKACSRSYAVRLLLQLISVLLYNLWRLCNACIETRIIMDEFKDIMLDCILTRREHSLSFDVIPAH